MAKKGTSPNEMVSLSIRHRAVCMTCNFKGGWQSILDDAYTDAMDHRQIKKRHIVEVLTEHTTRVRTSGLNEKRE